MRSREEIERALRILSEIREPRNVKEFELATRLLGLKEALEWTLGQDGANFGEMLNELDAIRMRAEARRGMARN
jgi:hypothetical protein